MSKGTKRAVGLGILLLCLTAGVATLRHRRSATGPEQGAPVQATAPPPRRAAVPGDSPEMGAPAASPEPGAPVGSPEPNTPGLAGQTAMETADPPGRDTRPRRKREPTTRWSPGAPPPGAARPLASAAPSAAPAEIPAAAPASAPAVEEAPPQKKRGNVAVHVRPRLGGTVPAFQLMTVTTLIDGRVVATSEGKGFESSRPLEVFTGTLEVGEHALNILAEYRGNGHNVFSYFEGYRYTARSSIRFAVKEGTRSEITVDLLDKGGVTRAFEDRLAIAFIKR
jgi:hypothetical protein